MEDDEIPLDSSTEESQSSSDVSMSDSDREDEPGPLISTGNEHIPTRHIISHPGIRFLSVAHPSQGHSKKRKTSETADTTSHTALPKKVKVEEKARSGLLYEEFCPSDRSLLPAEIWHRIFTFTPPRALGNLLRTNKLFNVYLNPSSEYQCTYPRVLSQTSLPLLGPDVIWQLSRRRFWQRMPAPLQGKTELDMWRLACGKTCQFCDEADPLQSRSRSGMSQPVWAFGLRSCGPCLVKNTVKELDLLLSSSVPSLLMPALPFVLITSEMKIVSADSLQKGLVQQDLQVTKIYLPENTEKLKAEFLAVKSMGSATIEEWLKGLEVRGRELLNDSMRWDKWTSTGGVTQMQTLLPSDCVPNVAVPNSKGLILMDISSSTSRSHSSMSNTAGHKSSNPSHISPSTTASQSKHNSTIAFQQNNSASQVPLSQHGVQAYLPRARTREEALKLKAARRAEIERRAMGLDPPLPVDVLARIPSFQAAIQIISPLDNNAWDLLKPRLLSQRADAERTEHDTPIQPYNIPERPDEGRNTEESSMAAKQLIDKTWDDVQAPLRARISAYADETIHINWDDGRKVNMENSVQFAAEVLLCIRKRFYDEIAKESADLRAAGQEVIMDPPEGPFTKKLTLENMKWLFDAKIKPHTESYRKDLFYCNGCEGNFKTFGFEGVIQHYAAKHTNALSLGSVVVHWRAEWPETPPFRSESWGNKALYSPTIMPKGAQNSIGHPLQKSSTHSSTLNSTPFHPPPYPYYTLPQSSYEHPRFGPMNSYGLGQHDYTPQYPHPSPYTPHGAQGTVHPGPPMPFSPGFHPGPPTYPPTAEVFNSYNSDNSQGNSHFNSQQYYGGPIGTKSQAQLEFLAKTSREVWTSMAGLKDLPGYIRVCVVVHHVVRRFQSRFSETPLLTIFIDGLSNNKEMRPVRNVNGLMCKACNLGLGYGTSIDPDRKTFSLPQLVNHFQRRHVEQPQAIGSPNLDWTRDMVHTPDLSVLFRLHRLTNIDSRRQSLISDAFPAIGYHSYPQESSNIQNTLVDPNAPPHTNQLSSYSTMFSQAMPQNNPSSLHSIDEHDKTLHNMRDYIQNHKLGEARNSRAAPLSSAEIGQESGGKGSKKQKGTFTKGRNTSGQGNRKGGRTASPAKGKLQELGEDLVTEEERRHGEEIQAMWAAERKESARLASKTPYLVGTKESNVSVAMFNTEPRRNHYTEMAQINSSPTFSTQITDHHQLVTDQDTMEDLFSGLESQLDRQHVSYQHSGHQSRHIDDVSHEGKPSSGRYVENPQDAYLNHRHPYDQYRERSPVSGPVSLVDGDIRAPAPRDDMSYEHPRRGYYDAYTDDARVRHATSQYSEAYEVVRMRDSRGEYFIRQPIELMRESPPLVFQDGHTSHRDVIFPQRVYENDAHFNNRSRYEYISRTETALQQPTARTGTLPEGVSRRSFYESAPMNDASLYEDYDPRFPVAPPFPDTSRQARY